ncbi:MULTISPECIES: hypothetical protein [Niastella]|uniref:Uncharacterized protein n=1 Tax=Niastella soli TaxID=2821487 RepID=A0ABS3YNA6_9BACT|nr:hypothetical protein [Niastella soli]MBO9199368.1 hypothetical protein [Niastella soli]
MAKSAKKAKSKPEPQPEATTKTTTMNTPILTTASLVAEGVDGSLTVDVTFMFSAGIGQATALLFRKGVLINMQSISSSGKIHFSEVQSRDSIAVNGVCTGTADITVNTPTIPESPLHFDEGLIISGFLIK